MADTATNQVLEKRVLDQQAIDQQGAITQQGAGQKAKSFSALTTDQRVLQRTREDLLRTTGGEYLVTPENATAVFPSTLRFDDDVRIVCDSRVVSIYWEIEEFSFGQRVTFDLTRPVMKPAKAARGANGGTQAQYGRKGTDGQTGATGTSGADGASLTLVISKLDPVGSLWIRTDGSEAGDGGDGGDGAMGGGTACGYGGLPHCDGGDGGNAGAGGSGGVGGNTSTVSIRIKNFPASVPTIPPGASDTPAPSQRPTLAEGDDGRIIIWGSPGAGGKGGNAGRPGPGGDEGYTHDCGPLVPDTHGGHRGRVNSPGAHGTMGTKGKVEFKTGPNFLDQPRFDGDGPAPRRPAF